MRCVVNHTSQRQTTNQIHLEDIEMIKYTKKLVNAAAIVGMFLSHSAISATSIQEVVNENSNALRAGVTVEATINHGPALVATSFREVVEANSTSIRANETPEAYVHRGPALVSTSIRDVIEAQGIS